MTNTRPEIEFAHVFDIDTSVKTVRAFGYEIPQEFQIRYFIKSKNTNSKVCWSLGLEIEISDEGKPQTKAISFQGDLWRFWRKDSKGRDLYWPVEKFAERQKLGFEPIDFEKVRRITSSTRTMNHFQSLAVAVVIHSFDLTGEIWRRRNAFPNLSSKELKQVEKKFLQRKAYVPRNTIDYERVADLYFEAKGITGERASVREYISVHYNESDEMGDVKLDTVNNWIKTCRDLKLLPESNYGRNKNSTPSKSVGKATTKKGTK